MSAPLSFNTYLAEREPGPDHSGERCDSCGEGEPLTSDGYCRACLRYMFGHDQAEDAMLEATLGAAVNGALGAGASTDQVLAVVGRAIRRHDEDVREDLAIGLERLRWRLM